MARSDTPRTEGERRVAVALGLERQVAFWIAALIAVIGAIWLLHEILLPFVAGAVLAYLFNPLAYRLERLGANRLLASLAIIGVFVLSFIVLLLLIVPILGGQLAAFIEKVPAYVRRLQSLLADPDWPWLKQFLGENLSNVEAPMGDLVTQGARWLTAFLRSLWSGGQALISIFSLMVVTPVVAFYLLYDWERMICTVDAWVPVPQRETVRRLAREIDGTIAGFLRGQSGVCLILGSFYAVGLTLAGLNFGLLIGLVSGLITFVPYVGSMTGLVLATGVAVAQFWPNGGPIVTVVAIFFVGQFLEGYILAPKLVGESVGLHPVWLMFALFAFGYLFGFVGMLLAVPLAAAIGVVVRFALRRYLASPLYTGEIVLPDEPTPPFPEKPS
jgi:predicted PurR-regulated permease PerM